MNHKVLQTFVKVIMIGVVGSWLMGGHVVAKSGEGHGPKAHQQGKTGKMDPSVHSLNMKFKTDRTTLRDTFKTSRNALRDKMKAGTITKAEFVAQKKALIDQFKIDRETLRNKYKLAKKELQAELNHDIADDKEDLKDDEKNEK